MSITEEVYNVFNSEGRLLQVEYALERIYNSHQIVSLVCNDGIIFISKRIPQPPLKDENHTSIHKIGDNLYVNITGSISDIDFVVDKCKIINSSKEYDFACSLTPDIFTKYLADKFQKLIQKTGKRAPAFAATIGGFDNGKPLLFYTDVSAVEFSCFAISAGEDYNKINKYLEKNYKMVDRSTAINIGISALMQSIGQDAEASEIEVAILTINGVEYLNNSQIDEIIQNIQGNN